jgi:two-component system chemotaxis response regulator CheB
VEALVGLLGALPADLPAAVLVCLHVAPGTSVLPRILTRAGVLPASHPDDGEEIRTGRVYVAPPDRHLVVADGTMRLVGGPTVNRARPAIDPLFTSAAQSYDSRVIGVILSGMLDDGTAGLRAIRARGGLAVVQDPDDALFPGMPSSAVAFSNPDHIVPLARMAALLETLVTTPYEPRDPVPAAGGDDLPGLVTDPTVPFPGEPVDLSCPDCSGTLRLVVDGDGKGEMFRCRVGHVFSPETLLDGQADQLEKALWAAAAALGEQADLARRMARRMHHQGLPSKAAQYETLVERAEEHAHVVQAVAARVGHARSHEEPPDVGAG